MDDLFSDSDASVPVSGPLADLLRPGSFADVVGQNHLLGDGPLGRMVASGKVRSLVFWGPPGTGKTTMARLLAEVGDLTFVQMSAIFSGVGDLKKVFEAARLRRQNGQKTLLFVDEIHRFNRSQQDSFLPFVEDGTITLVGATTENPSFELNGALVSRMQVLVLKRLDEAALGSLVSRAEEQLGLRLPLDEEARELLLTLADGDGRYLLNMVEGVVDAVSGSEVPDSGFATSGTTGLGASETTGAQGSVIPAGAKRRAGISEGGESEESAKGRSEVPALRSAAAGTTGLGDSGMAGDDGSVIPAGAKRRAGISEGGMITASELLSLVQRKAAAYDKDREGHYNLISALHKALRGSDADAALYWLARMLVGGEDPLYIARRLIRFASEDIGLADPQALPQALAARQAFEVLGSPEGELAIVQAILYLATAPKSNAAYKAQKQAWKVAKQSGSLMPPAHSLNAPTKMMKDLGYGEGYAYDHDSPEAFSGQNFFPDELPRQTFYQPPERGFEREINKRLAYWKARRGKV